MNMLNEEIVLQMMEIFDFNLFGDALFENVWWFQDGAPPHWRNIVTGRLRELFGNHVVALNWDREWPARSPDLTPCDFCWWVYIKSKVYTSPYRELVDLRTRIIREFEALINDEEMLIRAVAEMRSRSHKCEIIH